MPGLSATGFEAKALSTIEEEIGARMRANISPTLNLSSRSVMGEWNGCVASQARQCWEAAQEGYASRDPETAEGAQLDSLLKLVIGKRIAATHSTALMTITLAAGTYAAGTLVVYVVGNPDARFTNDAAITSAGATEVGVPFTAEAEGAVVANLGTLTQIANPVTGFSAPTNPAAATLGSARETDAEYRARWRLSLARKGSTSVDAIRADLLASTDDDGAGATFAVVRENTGDAVDGDGVASRGIGAWVLGGTDADVAQVLFESKAAGIATSGTTTINHTDSQGQVHAVKFTRPAEVLVYIEADVTVLTGTYPTEEFATVDVAILHGGPLYGGNYTDGPFPHAGGTHQPGEDVIYKKVLASIMGVPGVVDCTDLQIGLSAPASGTANLAMTLAQYAEFNGANITVNLTYVDAVP